MKKLTYIDSQGKEQNIEVEEAKLLQTLIQDNWTLANIPETGIIQDGYIIVRLENGEYKFIKAGKSKISITI